MIKRRKRAETRLCPFCGGDTAVVEKAVYYEGQYICRCSRCDAITKPAPTAEDAKRFWNKHWFTPETYLICERKVEK